MHTHTQTHTQTLARHKREVDERRNKTKRENGVVVVVNEEEEECANECNNSVINVGRRRMFLMAATPHQQ